MKFLIFGFGYSAKYISRQLQSAGSEICATVRSSAKSEELARLGVVARVFSPSYVDPQIADDIASSDAILSSIPPGDFGDPALESFAQSIANAPKLRWVGYLSTVGVYGDHS